MAVSAARLTVRIVSKAQRAIKSVGSDLWVGQTDLAANEHCAISDAADSGLLRHLHDLALEWWQFWWRTAATRTFGSLSCMTEMSCVGAGMPGVFQFIFFAMLLGTSASGVAVERRPSVPCPRPTVAVAEADRKFTPGHYVAVGRAETPSLKTAAKTAGIDGVQRRYRWVQLEPAPGVYDFAAISRDLEVMAGAGVQLVAMIEDKTFDGTIPTPTDLQDGPRTLRGSRGYVANRWDPVVIERLVRLVDALGEQFDCHPNFEGIAFQESALSLDQATLSEAGYTPEKYRDALIRLLRAADDSVPRSRVFWYMNFLPGNQGYLDDIAASVLSTGVVMGGPDILPENSALASRTYPIYRRFQGRMKLFGSMQHDSYRHPRGANGNSTAFSSPELWSMEDLFLFARDELHVDYVFWEFRSRRKPADSRDWNEARDVIVRYPGVRAARPGERS
jgi:hypothetical protein